MKASNKVTHSLFKKHIARFIIIIAIVVVSVGFMSGVGEVKNKVYACVEDYYQNSNVSDLYLKSSNPMGFNQTEIDWILQKFGEENVLKSFSYEDKINDEIIRIYNYDINSSINKLELIEGTFPQDEGFAVVERNSAGLDSYEIGEVITINNKTFTISGIVLNPYIINQVEEPSFRYENEDLNKIFYINSLPFIVNDVYVTIEDRELFSTFSNEYKERINLLKKEVTDSFPTTFVRVLSLYENTGLYPLSVYADKVGQIANIFVVFFVLVTLLVVFSTLTRLLDEERAQIACQKTLGYSDFTIVRRYLWFVLLATIIGTLISYGVGLGLTKIIYSAFNLQYKMAAFPIKNNVTYFIISFVILFVVNAVLTIITGLKMAKKKPVTLLSPKTAKPGKKLFLEKIPSIWNKCSFKFKSTLRNVFLFKSRFFMTVISLIGSAVLVFAGMGIMDCSKNISGGESLITISLALLVFSAILCALVIYNISNINICERTREISTLMVLGYNDNEVCGYIFREIYIMSIIGAILGIPVSLVFIKFVFKIIDFGTVADINWWTWILTPLITMLFTFFSTLILRRKIIKTDMNASLKSNE